MRLIIRDLRHWRVKYDLLRLSILTSIVVVVWVGVEVYHSYVRSTIDAELQAYLETFNPTLDEQVLHSLQDRYVAPETFPIYGTNEETGTVEPLVLPVETASPSASQSAQLGQ